MSDLALHPTDLAWLRWVAGATVSTGILLAAAYALDVLLRRRVEARWRVLLPAVVLLRLALPIEWSSPLGVFGRHARVVATPDVTDSSVPLEPTRVAVTPPLATSAPPAPTPALAPMLHAGVALALLGAALGSRWRASSALRDARPARESVTRLAEGVPVVEHDVLGPAVVGLLRPRIVMPSPLVDALAEEEAASVLRHEVAHVRRRDPLTRMLGQLATFAAWPVLPAWLAASWLKGLVEQACDERALEGGGAQARGVHARALVDVATWRPRRLHLALGLLPFGEGVRARVRALRFSRRWATSAQLACVVILAPMLVLTLGARAERAEATATAEPVVATTPAAQQPRVPPLVRLRVEMFRAPVGDGGGMVLLDDGSDAGELLDAGQADLLRQRLVAEATKTVAPKSFSSLLDGRMVVQFNLLPAKDEPEERLSFVMEPGSAAREIELQLTTVERPADLRRKVSARITGEDATVHLVRFADSPHGAVHVLVTLQNVVFASGADARVDSPRLSLDVVDEPLADAAKALGQSVGFALPVDDAIAAKPVTISLTDVTWEDAVTQLAEAASVGWTLENPMVRLVAPAVPKEVEPRRASSTDDAVLGRLREIIDRAGVADVALEPREDGILLKGRVRDAVSLAALSNALRDGFEHAFLAIRTGQGGEATHFDMLLKWPVQVQALIAIVRLDAPADVDALVTTTRGPRQDDARVTLLIPSPASAEALDSRLDDFGPGSNVRVVSRPIVVGSTGQRMELTSRGDDRAFGVVLTARGAAGALAADVTLDLPWIPGEPIDAHVPVASSLLEIAEPDGGVTLMSLQLRAVEDSHD